MRPRLTIFAFSYIRRDARVLRQIKYLSPYFAVTVVGYEQLDEAEQTSLPAWGAGAAAPAPQKPRRVMGRLGYGLLRLLSGSDMRAARCYAALKQPLVWLRRGRRPALLVAGRLVGARAYEAWYWNDSTHQAALLKLIQSRGELILANDWNALPLAVRAAEATGARVVLDLHEYAPLELEDHFLWRLFRAPMVDYFLRAYLPRVAATVTLGETIAEKYATEYGIQPLLIRNVPEQVTEVEFRPTRPDAIRLIHHGAAIRERKLELMIEAVALCDKRYSLHFLLIGSQPEYIPWLQALAQRRAPGRVFFHEPVAPAEIVNRISAFDVGVITVPFANFNYQYGLPNKLFDCVMAGLAMCIGPSPDMRRVVDQFDLGVVTASFDPRDIAQALGRLAPAEIDRLKRNALAARAELNADVEMAKLVALHRNLAGVC